MLASYAWIAIKACAAIILTVVFASLLHPAIGGWSWLAGAFAAYGLFSLGAVFKKNH